MRSARLKGIRKLDIDIVQVPDPGRGEIQVKIEACGVCATDSRKYEIGVNDGHYPFNPGHEWLGRVSAVGAGVAAFKAGDRVYGDTYGGYADYATIPVSPIDWSRGPLPLPDDMPLECAIFIEPLADCIHAVRDQARLQPGHRLIVIAAGVMGLKIVADATRLGCEVLVVEPLAARAKMARTFGASAVVGTENWQDQARDWTKGEGADAVILTIGNPDLVMPCVREAKPGGRVVLFAGFGNRREAVIDLNDIHYREIELIGSEWIGTPPNQRRQRYDDALSFLLDRHIPFADLVTATCGFAGLEKALVDRQSYAGLKTMFRPEASSAAD
jgi:threonine dehydrogenase-like Zn-dependent dehydrogenase